ncbi:mRNA turnover protein 4 homolog [Papaver somniferum]|uniref:mRNA turnover protein 4 homolog n=1 Tax=Papaver somniferum TaxID=3469 RepID=UPI000E6F7659|nr:mRNA turnover protein 4 homolog [Papaver somniferum]
MKELKAEEEQKFCWFSCKVYIGRNKYLSKIIGVTPDKELKLDLHKIGIELDGTDDSGLLLTNKTKEEIFSKFREYEEFDFVKPGNTPMRTVVFEKDQVLPLPISSSARKLFPALRRLKMPVKLTNDQLIQLTEYYVVSEEGKRVTENASKILVGVVVPFIICLLHDLGLEDALW